MSAPAYETLPHNPFLPVLKYLMRENAPRDKVCITRQIVMTSADRLRAAQHARTGHTPSYTALIVKAVSRAMEELPYANRILLEGAWNPRIAQLKRVDCCIAVEADVPGREQIAYVDILRDTANRPLDAVARELDTLIKTPLDERPRWRLFSGLVERLPAFVAKTLATIPAYSARLWIQHRGGAVLITSPGKYGGDFIVGTWPWPLSFAFGQVAERAVAEHGQVVARRTVWLSMSFNRQIMAGAPAARLMARVANFLENAEVFLAPPTDKAAPAPQTPAKAPQADQRQSCNTI